MDSFKLKRALITLALVFAVVVVASYGLHASQAVIYWGVVFFPVAIYFSKDPRSLFVFSILAHMAWLRTPGYSSAALKPFNLAAVAFFVSSLALVAMNKLPRQRRIPMDNWLIGFVVILIITMAVRGTGFALFGGKTWGGGKYINMIALFCFYFATRKFEYNRSHIRGLIWGILFATGVLAFAQFLFSYTGGRTYGVTNFMQIQAEYAAGSEMLGNSTSIGRFTHFRWVAYALFPFCFFWPKQRFLSIQILFISVALMFFTGFRSEVVSLGIVYLISGYILAKQKTRFLFAMGVLGVVGYLTLLFLANGLNILPESVERSISFLPGIELSDKVAISTEKSTNWRFDVWAYCLKALPDYLLIGRGMSFDVMKWAGMQSGTYFSPEFFYDTHGYHSGPLSLLLDFGIFGLIAMTGFFISSSLYVTQRLKRIRAKTTICYKYTVCVSVIYIWGIIKFYLIYGDLDYYLVRLLVLFSIIVASVNYMEKERIIASESL